MFELMGLVLIIIAGYSLRNAIPVRSMKLLDEDAFREIVRGYSGFRLVDTRDYMEFERHSYPHSVNLPLGRLPFTWKRVLNGEDRIVLIDESYSRIQSAARKLKRAGIQAEGYYVIRDEKTVRCSLGRCV